MVPFAITLSDLIEEGGAYAGLAAFFGLAVLAVLHFANARELKRLREWAGRAPERAQELEQRVMQQAEEARRLRAQPQPPGAPAAGRPAPATAAAQAANPASAAAAPAASSGVAQEDGAPAPAPPGGKPAPAPPAPAPATAGAQPGSAATDATELEPAAADVNGAAPADQTAAAPPDDQAAQVARESGDQAAVARESGDQAAVAREAGTTDGGQQDAATTTVPPVPAARAAEAPANGVPGGARQAPPPAPASGPPPSRPAPPRPGQPRRPAGATRGAAALGAGTSASARPAGRRPTDRPGAAPPPRRRRTGITVAAALAGLAVVVVAAVTFLGDDSPPPSREAADRSAATATPEATRDAGSSTPSRAETEVVVLNGTTITGLAARVSDRISTAGFATGTPNTFTDQARSASVVFYADNSARRQAVAAAKLLNISDVQPMIDSARQLAPGADVVVVVGADQSA